MKRKTNGLFRCVGEFRILTPSRDGCVVVSPNGSAAFSLRGRLFIMLRKFFEKSKPPRAGIVFSSMSMETKVQQILSSSFSHLFFNDGVRSSYAELSINHFPYPENPSGFCGLVGLGIPTSAETYQKIISSNPELNSIISLDDGCPDGFAFAYLAYPWNKKSGSE